MSRIEMERELVREIQLLVVKDKATYDETMKIFKKIYANDETVENERLEQMFFPQLAEILKQKHKPIYDLFIKVFPKYSVSETSLSERDDTYSTYSTLERKAEKEFFDYMKEESERSSKKGGKRRKTNNKKRSKQKRTWRKYFGL
jgi:hypothetical protein